MSQAPTIAQVMQANAEQAVRHAREQFKWELDFSPASLERVDRIVDVLHVELPRSLLARAVKGPALDAEVWAMAKMWGAYVGETLRRQCGGRWRTTPTVDGHADLLLQTPVGTLRPVEQIRRRLMDGTGDGVVALYKELLRRSGGVVRGAADTPGGTSS